MYITLKLNVPYLYTYPQIPQVGGILETFKGKVKRLGVVALPIETTASFSTVSAAAVEEPNPNT